LAHSDNRGDPPARFYFCQLSQLAQDDEAGEAFPKSRSLAKQSDGTAKEKKGQKLGNGMTLVYVIVSLVQWQIAKFGPAKFNCLNTLQDVLLHALVEAPV
jgi:hypothetical protein